MRLLLTAALLLAIAACATAPAADDLAAYPAALVGTYDNAAQYAQAPADLKRREGADRSEDWIDQQSVTFATVPAPAFGPHVVYAEWRGADGAVSRQRLWAFRRDGAGVRLDVYSMRDRARLSGGADASAFTTLTASDVDGHGPACGLAVTSNGRSAWNAQTDPETCHITSQGGRDVAIDTRVTVMPTGVLYQEAGRLEDGAYAFRMPGGAPYDFRRRP